jgi:hypothetical protein
VQLPSKQLVAGSIPAGVTMNKKTIRDIVLEQIQDKFPFLDDSLLLSESLDEAFIGIAESFGGGYVAVYDVEEIIRILMRDGISYEDAREYYIYNILGSYMEDMTPIFMTKIERTGTAFLSTFN